jgi:SAM-dependent methyltransferase
MADVVDEHFVPRYGLDLDAYLREGDECGVHHVIRYLWALEVLEEMPGVASVLDLACGSGYGSHAIAERFPRVQVVGADYDQAAVEAAERSYRLPNLEFRLADATCWQETLGERTYDCIVSFDTIEHVRHRELFMENLVDHLAPAGLLLFSTPCGSDTNNLRPAWTHHHIEYSSASLFDFLSRYFRVIQRPDAGTLPALKLFERLSGSSVSYLLRMNPLVCREPIVIANPYSSHRQPVSTPLTPTTDAPGPAHPPAAAPVTEPSEGLRAWRIQSIYTPVAEAVGAVLGYGEHLDTVRAGETPVARVLQVGGDAAALAALLDAGPSGASGRYAYEVRAIVDLAQPTPFPDASYDCVVAIDWLASTPPVRRERLVRELGRIARAGIVIVTPFDDPAIVAAEARLDHLYRARTGQANAEMARHAELGLPEASAVAAWVKDRFEYVSVTPLESLTAWYAAESLQACEPAAGPEAAWTALAPAFIYGEETPYRSLLVAAAHTLGAGTDLVRVPDRATSLALHVATESARQRLALERLVEAVSVARERERAEFRETVASLAAELREREAAAERLSREVTIREDRLAEARAALADLEERADATAVHARNLQSLLLKAEAEQQHLKARLAQAEEFCERARLRCQEAEAESSALQASLQQARIERDGMQKIHEDFKNSRAGRALAAYLRVKYAVLRKKA